MVDSHKAVYIRLILWPRYWRHKSAIWFPNHSL